MVRLDPDWLRLMVRTKFARGVYKFARGNELFPWGLFLYFNPPPPPHGNRAHNLKQTLHYSSMLGKSVRYQVDTGERYMRTSLTLALREDRTGSIFYCHWLSSASLFLQFFPPWANPVPLGVFFREPAPLPNILFVYRIVFFYLRYLCWCGKCK